jgi:hypothetical protein
VYFVVVDIVHLKQGVVYLECGVVHLKQAMVDPLLEGLGIE